jgi:hypothetical protein
MNLVQNCESRRPGFGVVFDVNQFPGDLGLGLEFRQLAAVMGLNVRVGVAPERPQKGFLRILFGDPDDAPDRAERMMPQPQGDNLLFALPSLFLTSPIFSIVIDMFGSPSICRYRFMVTERDLPHGSLWSRYSGFGLGFHDRHLPRKFLPR